jgi:hypothetical protein
MLEVGRRQLLTYSWLRHHSVGQRRVAGGILIFVNDLLDPEGDPNEDLNEPTLSYVTIWAIASEKSRRMRDTCGTPRVGASAGQSIPRP